MFAAGLESVSLTMRETPALKLPSETAMYTASARVLGRRQGRLHDNQNNGFGPLFEPQSH